MIGAWGQPRGILKKVGLPLGFWLKNTKLGHRGITFINRGSIYLKYHILEMNKVVLCKQG